MLPSVTSVLCCRNHWCNDRHLGCGVGQDIPAADHLTNLMMSPHEGVLWLAGARDVLAGQGRLRVDPPAPRKWLGLATMLYGLGWLGMPSASTPLFPLGLPTSTVFS